MPQVWYPNEWYILVEFVLKQPERQSLHAMMGSGDQVSMASGLISRLNVDLAWDQGLSA